MLATEAHGVTPPTPNLARRTKQELIDIATQIGLDTSGKRDDIRARVKAYYDSLAAAAAAGEPAMPSLRQRATVTRAGSSLLKTASGATLTPRRSDKHGTAGATEENEEESSPSEGEDGEEVSEDAAGDGVFGAPSAALKPPTTGNAGCSPSSRVRRGQRGVTCPGGCALGYDVHGGIFRPGLLPLCACLYRTQKEISTVRNVLHIMLLLEFLQLCSLIVPFSDVTVGPIYFLTTGRSHTFNVPIPDVSALRSGEVFWSPLTIWLGQLLVLPGIAGALVNFDHASKRAGIVSAMSFCVARLLVVAYHFEGLAAVPLATAAIAGAGQAPYPSGGEGAGALAAPVTIVPLGGGIFDPHLPVGTVIATSVVGILFAFYERLAGQ